MVIQATGAGGAGAAQPARKLPHPDNAGKTIANRARSILTNYSKKFGCDGKVIINYSIDAEDGKLSVSVDMSKWNNYGNESNAKLADKIKMGLNGRRFQPPANKITGSIPVT